MGEAKGRRVTVDEFEKQVAISLGKLAELAGVPRKRFRRLLEAQGVRLLRSGRRVVVCRLELQDSAPKVYEALLQRLQAARPFENFD